MRIFQSEVFVLKKNQVYMNDLQDMLLFVGYRQSCSKIYLTCKPCLKKFRHGSNRILIKLACQMTDRYISAYTCSKCYVHACDICRKRMGPAVRTLLDVYQLHGADIQPSGAKGMLVKGYESVFRIHP